jgi:hypothetical protein
MPHFTGQPVRRNSYKAGECEHRIWRPTPRAQARRIVLAAKIYDRRKRKAGERNGPIGHVGIDVLDALAGIVDYKTGILCPSYLWLAERTRRSIDAIARALTSLREHGFLDWIRRHEPTGSDTGPYVRQTSNAYALMLPPAAIALLDPAGPAPIPDDIAHAQAEAALMYEERLAELPVQEAAAAVFGDGLGAAFARLASAIGVDRLSSDSAKRREPDLESHTQGKVGVALRATTWARRPPSAARGSPNGSPQGPGQPEAMPPEPGPDRSRR